MANSFGASVTKLVHEKNLRIVSIVGKMSVKDKRKVFSILRKAQPLEGTNYILPEFYGITLGEFCTAHVLKTDSKRKSKAKATSGP
jgi:hypothetical protein